MIAGMQLRARRRTNPLFDPDALRLEVGDERADAARDDPDNLDLLVWNVFSTLDGHRDREWLAHRLELFGGPGMRAPVRMSLWTGRTQEPMLQPTSGYAAAVRRRADAVGGGDLEGFLGPVEVPVRIEAPEVLALVDATIDTVPRGNGGRDRLVELIDAGLEHARRVDKRLAVGVVYAAGTPAADELSRRVAALREPEGLAAAMDHRRTVAPVVIREVTWQQLLRVWAAEVDYLPVAGGPVKAFLAHCRERGLYTA